MGLLRGGYQIADVVQETAPAGAVAYLVLTNLVALLPALQALYFARRDPRKRLFMTFYTTNVLLGMVISILYHFCQAATLCLAAPFVGWHYFDHIFATYNIAITVLLFVEREQAEWIVVSGFVALAVTILAVLSNPFHTDAAFIVFVVGMTLVYASRLLYHRGAPMVTLMKPPRPGINRYTGAPITWLIYPQIDGTYMLLGALTIALGVGCYLFDDNGYYNAMHGTWHALIFLAQYFILMGASRDVIGWRTPGENIDQLHAQIQHVRAGITNTHP